MAGDKTEAPAPPLWLLAGGLLAGGLVVGLGWHLGGRLLPVPVIWATVVGLVLMLWSIYLAARAPTRLRVLLVALAVLSGLLATDSRHAADYAHFRRGLFRGLPAPLRRSLTNLGHSPARIVDDMLARRTGAPGVIGYVRWRARLAFPALPRAQALTRLLLLWGVELVLVATLPALGVGAALRSPDRPAS